MINRREMIGVGLAGFIPFEGKAMKDKSTELLSKIEFLQPFEVFQKESIRDGYIPIYHTFENSKTVIKNSPYGFLTKTKNNDEIIVPLIQIEESVDNPENNKLNIYTELLEKKLLIKVNKNCNDILRRSCNVKSDFKNSEENILKNLKEKFPNAKYIKYVDSTFKYLYAITNSNNLIMPVKQEPTVFLHQKEIWGYMELGFCSLDSSGCMIKTMRSNELTTDEEMLLPYKDILNG